MKPMLFLGSVLVALGATPAVADRGQVFDHRSQAGAYPSPDRPDARRCFNGRFIAGANRSGSTTLFIQSFEGGIYQVELASACAALDSAEKITVRAGGGYDICSPSRAEVVVQTPAGDRRCRVADLRALTSSEVAALSARARR